MAIVLWLVFIVAGMFFFRRKFDVLTLAYLSSCVYFLPGAIPAYPMELGDYVVYLAVLLLLILAAATLDRRRPGAAPSPPDAARMKVYYRGLLLIYVPALVLFVLNHGDATAASKADVDSGGILYYFLCAILGYLFVVSIGLRKRLGIAVVLANYVWFIFTGDRTQFVIAVLALLVFFAAFHPVSIKRALGRIRRYQLLLAMAVLFVGLFGKVAYGAYFDWRGGRDFSQALALRFDDTINSPSQRFEPYHVQSILNMAIEDDDRIASEYLYWIPVQFLPFAGDLGSNVHDQSEAVKQLYFSSWSEKSGVSSNFFAEGFLLWGYAGALLFSALYVGVAFAFALLIASGGLITRLWASFGATFWAFYIHRSSLLQIISHEKRIVYSILLVVLVSRLLHTLLKSRVVRVDR